MPHRRPPWSCREGRALGGSFLSGLDKALPAPPPGARRRSVAALGGRLRRIEPPQTETADLDARLRSCPRPRWQGRVYPSTARWSLWSRPHRPDDAPPDPWPPPASLSSRLLPSPSSSALSARPLREMSSLAGSCPAGSTGVVGSPASTSLPNRATRSWSRWEGPSGPGGGRRGNPNHPRPRRSLAPLHCSRRPARGRTAR